eukprot:TRINITY_DN10835_c0_g1_i5.p1 TRINITY_DN10835_c0_g1~~TRINITY_DN10835_c0_g1_i5.p1  ORF type:complete len:286 (+),score=90.80 TRINITY_DN10835_c0_g1_i5:82-939(+)
MAAYTEQEIQIQAYYDGEASRFYSEAWGGQAIHLGMYKTVGTTADDVATASAKAEERLLELADIQPDEVVIDMGAAKGNLLRQAVKRFACKGIAVDLSVSSNALNRQLITEAGLDDTIRVHTASFLDVPEPDACADVIVSEDAFLHVADNLPLLMKEIHRLLKPGGRAVFHDILQDDNADESQLTAVYKRIHLTTLGSVQGLFTVGRYRRAADVQGLVVKQHELHNDVIEDHYTSIKNVLQAKQKQIGLSEEFVDQMTDGLDAWTRAGNNGTVTWGFLVVEKPAQ